MERSEISCVPESIVLARGRLKAKCLQCSLKHVGVIETNKNQGETLPLELSVEVAKECSPQEKVKFLCCSFESQDLKKVIAGEKNHAIQKMRELTTKDVQ